MRRTRNLGLALYDGTDLMNITGAQNSLNHNMELLDTAIGSGHGGQVESIATTPEMYGAVGDGVSDDTAAFTSMFASGNKCFYLEKTYKVSSVAVTNVDDLIIFGSGTIDMHESIIGTVNAIIFRGCKHLSMSGITINCNEGYIRALEINNCTDTRISNITVKNVGKQTSAYNHTVGIFLRNGSHNSIISGVKVSNINSADLSSGIWLGMDSSSDPDTIPVNTVIDSCLIEEIYPISNGDGVKVLGGGDNMIGLTVTNCTFINCSKRAIKFQAYGCHSANNKMVWHVAGFCPIDFQRGYCTSENDIIITDYDGSGNEDNGYFRFWVSADGQYNSVKNLHCHVLSDPSWIAEKSNAAALIGFGSLRSDVDSSSGYNVIDGVYGNAVARNLITMSFNQSDDEENSTAPDVSKFVSQKNVVKGIHCSLTNGTIIEAVADSSGRRPQFNYNDVSGEISVIRTTSLPLSSGNIYYNIIDLMVHRDGNLYLGNYNSDKIHNNLIYVVGLSRFPENIRYEGVKYGFSSGSIQLNQRVPARVVFSALNKPDTLSVSSTNNAFRQALAGDVCLANKDFVDSDGDICNGWVCIASPDASNTYGTWKDHKI